MVRTDAIYEKPIPPRLTPRQIKLIYASEVDLLNMALFGKTAEQWLEEKTGGKGNKAIGSFRAKRSGVAESIRLDA